MPSSFPTTNETIYSYLSVVVPYVVTHQLRLKIAVAKVDALTGCYGDAATEHTYLYVHGKWVDITKRTTTITAELGTLETSMKDKLMNIYGNIPADDWTDDDRAIFRRKTGLPIEIPVHHRAPIADDVFFKIDNKENSEFDYVCRKTDDGSRGSLPEGCDAVEVIFDIREYVDAEGNPDPSRTKKLPTNVSECEYKEVFYQSRFTQKLNPGHVGKYIVVYARWINTRHPEASGPWSGPQAADIR